MTDIYRASLRAKYDSLMRVIAGDLGLGNDLTALSQASLELVHNGAEQAILEWASRRAETKTPLRPITNLQHLLDEYCAIADHL